MASLSALLNIYDLEPGDTVYVDTGNYTLINNVILTADDAGVTIQGPTAEGHEALLDRGNTTTGSYGIQLTGTHDVTIDSLGITGASQGINLGGTAGIINDTVTISHNRVFGNQEFGIHVGNYNDNIQVTGNEVFGNLTGIRAGDYFGGSCPGE